MDVTTVATALWVGVYVTAAVSAVAALRWKEKQQELQPIPVEENPEAR